MKKILILTFVFGLMAIPAFGFSYNYYDFGQDNIFDQNNNWAPIEYPYGIGNVPSPGGYNPGGENFDLEALNVASDNDYLYVSITNSFGYVYSGFRMGDLFIGVGENKYKYAVDIRSGGTTNGLWEVSSWTNIQQASNSYYSNTAIRDAVGAHEVANGSMLGSVSSMLTYERGLETDYLTPGNGNTYVWELRIDRSLINGGDLKNLSFHVNVGCGNDLMEKSYSAVPEPATMLLFGLGLVGGGVVRRFRQGQKK